MQTMQAYPRMAEEARLASDGEGIATVIAVVVTRNRHALLARCLAALERQDHPPDRVIVVDNASDPPVDAVVAAVPSARLLRLASNQGPARGFGAGVRAALAVGASHVWMMDDDGIPDGGGCLARLLATARREGSALTCPLLRNEAAPERLAFPIRQRGRTRFTAAALEPAALIEGFAHLFNGALVTAAAFRRIGLPEGRLFIRGDEVEFLLRARRAGLRVVTDTSAGFLHPASDAEIHPILGGAFYAVVPGEAVKRHYQFRNRGWIFSRYGLWGWLAADHVRYACYYLGTAHDPAGYLDWLRATWRGVAGRLDEPHPVAEPQAALALRERAS